MFFMNFVYLCDASEIVVILFDLFPVRFALVWMVSQHLEPIGLLDVVVSGFIPQRRQAKHLVVVLVLGLLGVKASQVLQVVFEVRLFFACTLRLRVLQKEMT